MDAADRPEPSPDADELLAQARWLLAEWTKDRFDHVLKDLRVLAIQPGGDGRTRCRISVHQGLQNRNGMLHGGAMATLIDVVGTMAVLAATGRAGVTTDLSASYCSAAAGDTDVEIVAYVLKAGRTLAFAQVDIRRVDDDVLVASGRHTKFIAPAPAHAARGGSGTAAPTPPPPAAKRASL